MDVFKETAEALTPPLLILLHKSLDEGSLPDDWKKGNITAIYKKGSKANPGNYHPISLTSIICKLLEAIIRDAIVTHMSVNNLFCDQQHGFVPGRSCITQLLTTFEIWTQAVENGNPVDAIYLDFQKTFDSVPHHRLIRKLAATKYVPVALYDQRDIAKSCVWAVQMDSEIVFAFVLWEKRGNVY